MADVSREKAVLDMRAAGVTFERIATELHYASRGAARNAWVRAKKRADSQVDAADERDLELLRIDKLHQVLWSKALNGSVDAVDRIIRLTELRLRIKGQSTPNDGELRAALEASIAANTRLDKKVDAGLIATARKVADRIDAAVALGEGQEVTKALYLVPHLNNLFREMLATPAARVGATPAAGGGEQAGGRLAGMRRGAPGMRVVGGTDVD